MIGPLFGLSVIVHLCIIGWHKVTRRLFPAYTQITFQEHGFLSRALSVSISVLFFLFIMWNGLNIVSASLSSKHTSYRLIEHMVPKAIAYANRLAPTVTADIPLTAHQEAIITLAVVLAALILLIVLVSKNDFFLTLHARAYRKSPRSRTQTEHRVH